MALILPQCHFLKQPQYSVWTTLPCFLLHKLLSYTLMFYFILENINHQLEETLFFFSMWDSADRSEETFFILLCQDWVSQWGRQSIEELSTFTLEQRDNSLFLAVVFDVIRIYFFNHSGCIQVVSGSGCTQWIIILLAYTGIFMSCSASLFVRGRWNPIKVKLKATKKHYCFVFPIYEALNCRVL